MLLIMLSIAMTVCGNDGDEGNQSRTEVVPDPEGTVTQNVWWKDAWTQENLGIDGVTVQCMGVGQFPMNGIQTLKLHLLDP